MQEWQVMLKILQARLQLYMNQELPYIQDEFWRGKGTNICWITEKARGFQKTSASLTMLKSLNLWVTKKCGKFLEMGIPDQLTCLLIKLYEGKKAKARTGHGTMDWFKLKKEVCQACISLPYLFNLQSISCKMQGWMNHKLKSRLLGKISANSNMQMLPL